PQPVVGTKALRYNVPLPDHSTFQDMLIFPILHTERLILRQLRSEDLPALARHANNRKIAEQIINLPHPYGEPQAAMRMAYVVQGFKERSRFVFAIIHREREELIGEVSLHLHGEKTAQLGYWLGEPFWGQGLATEAAKAVLTFGQETLALDRIEGSCYIDNPASERVLRKIGLQAGGTTGRLRQYGWVREG
ncbi:MAG: GNAT family N-acetyltransferase, partial [Lewinella sp.]|nr:GNAT family N-acetyltransferase [Lewinella sp.]